LFIKISENKKTAKRFEAINGNKKMIIINETLVNHNEICILQ